MNNSRTDQKKYNILYVDDEEANLRIFKYSFNREYNVFLASSGGDALDIVKSNQIHLIITDQRMPKMTGVDLLKMVVPTNPKMVRMILTGFSDIGALVEAVNDVGIHKYIQKPWDRNELKKVFEEELEKTFGKGGPESPHHEENESNEIHGDIEAIQQSFLKEDKQLTEIFGEAVLIKHNPRGISSDIYWVGKDRAEQRIVVMLDTHLQGIIAGMISVGLYGIVGEMVMASDKVDPRALNKQIKDEYSKRYYDSNIKKYTDKPLNISVAVFSKQHLHYFGNYHAVKPFTPSGELVSEMPNEGHISLSKLGKVFIHSNGLNLASVDGETLDDLMIGSAELDFRSYIKYITTQAGRLSNDASIDDMTMIGINFRNGKADAEPIITDATRTGSD